VGWFRMMGAESVEYHRRTVLERADDYPGMALTYYASRGETPMRWGGAGAVSLGLVGTVTGDTYEAIFGIGGAHHPDSGERLVSVRRPGMEIVISAPLFRILDNGAYAESWIMPSRRRRRPCCRGCDEGVRHNHRDSRKARSWSGGL
jgi:hypothetical protein